MPLNKLKHLDICYQHIAQTAPAPDSINTQIPQVLAQIILKLINKTPETRYQNLYCLQTDLQTCQQQWHKHANIPPFTIAQADISSQFIIPEYLYGREAELAQLQQAFEDVYSDKEAFKWFIVEGHPGVGKTALVQELQTHIAQSQGYFISGKFDQFQRHQPYHCFISSV